MAIAASFEVGQHDGRAVGAEQSEQLDAGAKLGRLREETGHVLGVDGLHIGDRAVAQMGEFLRRQRQGFVVFHSHRFPLSGGPSQPASERNPVARRYLNCPHHPLRLRPDEIDREQPLRKIGAKDLHALGEKKAALELPRGDAAVQIFPRLVLLLPAADHQLILLDRDLDLFLLETGHRKRDAQFLRVGDEAGIRSIL